MAISLELFTHKIISIKADMPVDYASLGFSKALGAPTHIPDKMWFEAFESESQGPYSKPTKGYQILASAYIIIQLLENRLKALEARLA